MNETLGNKAIPLVPRIGTNGSTETPPAKPDELNSRQEAFCRMYAEGGIATDAYEAAYTTSNRAVARAAAARLLRHNPRVRARVRELQDAAAGRAQRPVAALIAELEAMVDADPNEVMRLDVCCCRHCWGDKGGYQFRDEAELGAAMDRWLASHSGPKPLPAPDTSGGFGFDPGRDSNPSCGHCEGAGVQRVKFASTADVSPGARRLLRGIELFPDGSVKRVLLHDQTQLRIELHKLRGLHIDRSVNVNVNVPTLKDMTNEQALDFLDSLKPAT